ncbi:MAG: hypothetical protein HOH16_13070, partial [Planctomycetaceae bacterium]|nr:hypothetical protein [Planctomycetaceae bacterium]
GGDKPTKSGGAAGSGPGNLVGRFILDGAAPNLSPLIAKGASVKDAEYCSAEAVPNQSLVVGEMESAMDLEVPLEVSVQMGSTWADCEK